MAWEYLPQFAACRDVGHQWDYFEWYGGKRTLVCASCDTKRVETLDGHAVVTRRYIYANGYSFKDTPVAIKDIRRMLQREGSKLDRWVGKK
jgi:hypothetical protein